MVKSKSGTLTPSAGWPRGAISLSIAGLSIILAACAGVVEPEPVPPEPVPALPDGQLFAFVTMGTDETGARTVGVDVADLLSGEEARERAIEDGVIEEGEDLPNDFYIDNDEIRMELLHLADDLQIWVISGNDTTQLLEIDEDELWQLWEGEYGGEPVYGIVATTPIAMDVTIRDGEISGMKAVYLP